jgi:lipoprotein-releasing system permease protein
MNFPFYIAKRYLFSKKSHNIINIISGISVVGVMVGTLALIVVLSVFNGFEDLVKSLFNSFNPDLQITVKEGKTFDGIIFPRNKIEQIPGVISYTEVVEENALLKFKSEQYIVAMKGVSNDFLIQNPMDSMLVDGNFILEENKINFTIMGYLVAYHLGIKINDFSNPITVYVPKRTKKSIFSLDQSFNSGFLIPSSVFSIQQEIDSKYIIVPINFAREMLEYTNELTGVEIRLATGTEADNVQQSIQRMIGEKFVVKNRYQQQELLYKIMKSEKWAIFFILTFIIIIAAFNVVGSLSMLILDKRKDIAVLFSLGADEKKIKRVFIQEGLMITLIGILMGLFLGFILCFAQIKFGLIKLGSDSGAFVVPYYPVNMKMIDFVAVFGIVFLIGIAATWYPVKQISSKYLHQRISDFVKSQ